MRSDSDRALLSQIGKIIKRKRRKTKYSQEDLAECLDTSQATICRYEQGQTNLPVLTLKHIADKCDFDMTDYFIKTAEPSDMYKQIVHRHRRIPKKRTRADIEFDKIMREPENPDKVKALYHLSELSVILPKPIGVDYIFMAQNIILEQPCDHMRYERLNRYCQEIGKLVQ